MLNKEPLLTDMLALLNAHSSKTPSMASCTRSSARIWSCDSPCLCTSVVHVCTCAAFKRRMLSSHCLHHSSFAFVTQPHHPTLLCYFAFRVLPLLSPWLPMRRNDALTTTCKSTATRTYRRTIFWSAFIWPCPRILERRRRILPMISPCFRGEDGVAEQYALQRGRIPVVYQK